MYLVSVVANTNGPIGGVWANRITPVGITASTSTGEFTITTAGTYFVGFNCIGYYTTSSGTQTLFITLRVNGAVPSNTLDTAIDEIAINIKETVSVFGMFTFAASDVLRFYVSRAVSWTLEDLTFTIARQ
jgi:hypothetical protein